MINIQETILHLKEYADRLNSPFLKEPDKIKREALKAISDLSQVLKEKEFTTEELNEAFEVVQVYSQLDLTVKNPSFYEKVQNIFSVFKYAPSQASIQDTITLIKEKRHLTSNVSFQKEKAKVIQEHEKFILAAMNSEEPKSVKEHILSLRKSSPRAIISPQEEITILLGLIREKMQMHSQTKELENLLKLSKSIKENLFSFEETLETSFVNKADEFNVVLLKPNPQDFNHESVEKLRAQRLFRLENLLKVYQQSANEPNLQTAGKFFFPTCGWYIGAFQREEKYSLLELEMQQIGQKHGIKVIADRRLDYDNKPLEITADYRTDLMLDCEPLMKAYSQDVLGPFVQDFVDFSKNNEVRIPRLKAFREEEDFSKQLESARKQRSNEWRDIYESTKETSPPLLGAPFLNDLPLKALALASTLKATPIMNLTYNEGGNSLMGQRGSQPFVIIGQDSYDISKLLIEKDLGREVTEDEMRMAFALDYGVFKENVHFVEQPGDFHLDMSMAIVGENTIVLNDAELAQNLFEQEQQQWLQNAVSESPHLKRYLTAYVEEEIREASVRKQMEDITAQNLKDLGFQVIRVPGRLNYSSRKPAMNLFNMVTAQTPKGENIAVMLGCINEDFEELFRETLFKHCDRKIDALYFLELKSSQDSLLKGGGLSCRTKSVPSKS